MLESIVIIIITINLIGIYRFEKKGINYIM